MVSETQIHAFRGIRYRGPYSDSTVFLNTYRRYQTTFEDDYLACIFPSFPPSLRRVGSSDFLLSRDVYSSEHTRGP